MDLRIEKTEWNFGLKWKKSSKKILTLKQACYIMEKY